MASTYTSNTGIEKIGTGEQAGTWGTTSNRNFDIIDTALNGVVTITLSGTTHTLTTTDGTVTDGMNKVLVLAGSPSGTNTITISPNDQEKLYFVSNGSGQSAVFTQGSGASVTVLNGTQAIIYANGAGSGAAVAEIKPIASAGSIGTSSIADDAVTADKIADDAIVTAAIADDAVVTASIADDAITADLIADDAVGAAAIADNSVGAAAINISGDGTAGQLVTSDGDGSFSYTNTSSISSPPTIQKFTSSGTWNRPTGCKTVKVTVVGGGGGAGGANSSGGNYTTQGGGGGGAAIEYIDVTGTSSVTVTRGAGGSGGVGSNGNFPGTAGSSGGTSSFGSFCSATGGSGGAGTGGGSATVIEPSANGGNGSGGKINIRGTIGGLGTSGFSIFGGNRSRPASRGNGTNGVANTGAGGGPAYAEGFDTARTGGAGGSGIVIVEEYY
jgi:hypothetical protein